MASKQFFDPLALLRAAPVVTSSFSLMFCFDQYFFYNNMIIPHNRARGNEMLPGYWKTFLTPALVVIFSLYGSSLAGGLANCYTGAPSSFWYKLGAAFTAAHFVFVPWVSPLILAMIEDNSKGQSSKDMRRWLNVHTLRSFVVDLPGWACFLVAALQSLKPE